MPAPLPGSGWCAGFRACRESITSSPEFLNCGAVDESSPSPGGGGSSIGRQTPVVVLTFGRLTK